MQPSINHYWQSLSLFARLGISLSSTFVNSGFIFIIFRSLSLLQTFLGIFNNIKPRILQYQTLFQPLFEMLESLFNSIDLTFSSSSSFVLLVVLTVYFMCEVAIMILILCSLSTDKLRKSSFLKLFATHMTFHAEILYYPINLALFKLFDQINEYEISMSFVENKILLSMIIILLCLNISFTVYNILYCFSRIKISSFISRKGSIHLLGIAILKFFLPFFRSLFMLDNEKLINYEISSVIISLIASLGLLLYTTTVLPEYDIKLIKIHIVFNSLILGISINQLIELIIGEAEFSFILSIIIIPFWIKYNLNRFQVLIHRIKYNPDNLSNLGYCAHLELLYDQIENNLEIKLNKKRFLKSFLEVNQVFVKIRDLGLDHLQPIDQLELRNFGKISKIYLRKKLENLLNDNPKDVLASLTYAKLILNHFSLYSKAYYYCKRVSRQRIHIPDQISVFVLKERLCETLMKETEMNVSINSSTQLVWYQFRAEHAFQEFLMQLYTSVEKLINFWQTFKAEKLEVLNLLTEAASIKKTMMIVESKWNKYESKFSHDHPLGYLYYGILKTQFLNLPLEGSKHIEKYNLIIENKHLQHNASNLINDEHGILIISGEKETLGKILNYSGAILKIFKRDKKSLLHMDINSLMPKYFQEIHGMFLTSHYETGHPTLAEHKTNVFGKDVNGNVFPMVITFSISPDLEKGIVYMAMIQKNKDENEYIFLNENRLIEEVSSGVEKFLGIKSFQKISITSVCPDFRFDDFKGSLLQENKTNKVQTEKRSSKEDVIGSNSQEGKLLTFKQVGKSSKETSFVIRTEAQTYLHFEKTLTILILKFQIKLKDTAKLQSKSSNNTKMSLKYWFANNFELLTGNRAQKQNQLRQNTDFETYFFNTEMTRSKTSAVSTNTQGRIVDSFQKKLMERSPNKHRALYASLFTLILLTSFSIVGLHYTLIKDSVYQISFATNSIRTTYERLTSLGWAWWYCLVYTTRVYRIVSPNIADLNRFKTYIRANRQKMKVANDDLLMIVGTGANYQSDEFFVKNIKFIDINSSIGFQDRQLNSFEAINILVDRLIKFDVTPHETILEFGNLDLDFVRQNSMNDLLLASEGAVKKVESLFADQIAYNSNLLNLIFIINLLINGIAILLIAIIFYNNHRSDVKIMKALLNIRLLDINQNIYRLSMFQKLLKEDTPFPKKIRFHSLLSLEESKIKKRNYNLNGVLIGRLKKSLVAIFLIICFSHGPFINFFFSKGLLDELLKTNNRTIVSYKARYNCILGISSIDLMAQSLNKTTMRNQRFDLQLLENVKAVFSNEILFDTFTDVNAKFIDPSIETLFRGKPCSLLVDYPGSQHPTNCPRQTHNQTIGIFALNSYYREELYSLALQLLGDLTYERGKQIISSNGAGTAPRAHTLMGSFLYLINFMNAKFEEGISNILNDARDKLILQFTLMTIIGLIMMYFLIKKILNDPAFKFVIQLLPFEVILSNKLLNILIQDLYQIKMEVFNNNTL